MKITFIIILLFIISCEKGINDPKPQKPQKDYLEYGNVVKEGLIANYPFDGNAKDYSGNEYNGFENGPSASVGRFGQNEGALKFDGFEDYIEVPNFTNVNGDSGTICFWVRTPSIIDINRESAIISKIDTVGIGYLLSVYGYKDFWFEYKTQGVRAAEYMRTNYWKDGKYLFIAVTFSTKKLTCYFEGYPTLEITLLVGDLKFNDNIQSLFIGKSLISKYEFFQGEIDDMLIYNRALSSDEILELYNWE